MNSKIIIRRDCGFFSDFLTGLAGIMYCQDNNQKFHFDWKSNLYLGDDVNLYDSFFKNQLAKDDNFDIEYHNLTPYGYYFTEIVNRNTDIDIFNLLEKPKNTLNELGILDTPFFNNIDKNYFNGEKILGVHKRGTDHFTHGITKTNDEVLEYINDEFRRNSYDKIFLVTDDLKSLNFFKDELGDKLIYTDSLKIDSTVGIHYSNLDKAKIAREVVSDAFLLSLTNFKLFTKSNVSTFANICNLNKDTFIYMDKNVIYR